MTRIETTLTVKPNGEALLKLPEGVEPGEHRAVVMIDDAVSSKEDSLPLPSYDLGPWPEGFRVSREEIYGDDGR